VGNRKTRVKFFFSILVFFVLIQKGNGVERGNIFLNPAERNAQISIVQNSADAPQRDVTRFPADNARDVNPDTHLQLLFRSAPVLGISGQIRIYDAADDRLVDLLDLSIPPGPTMRNTEPAPYTSVPYQYGPGRFTNANTKPGTPSGIASPAPDTYQLTIIGGFTDGFHFYPVIIHDSAATISLHNNLLEFGRSYYVQIDSGVLTLSDGSFHGITGKTGWRFSTKKLPPPVHAQRLVVSGDGTGDFNTVQGAIDFIPDQNPDRVTIFIKKGTYEEIVYFRNKTNITFLGEERDKVIVRYKNNEVFNPHPSNVATNEMPGTFPSRRAAFMGDHSRGIHLINLSIESTAKGQAEGLLLEGNRNIISNVNVLGSGDALQINGSVYITNSRIEGDGDIILGRGPAFFNNCGIHSHGGPFQWIRNGDANHGNVFLNCIFQTMGDKETEIARGPTNHGKNYPYAEAVLLNCKLAGISPVAWGPIGGDSTNIHYWEFNSTNLIDGTPVDVSRRHPVSRQLTERKDSQLIARYRHPEYVLDRWAPALAPVILSQPADRTTEQGRTVRFSVKAAAIPEPDFQWLKNGKVLKGRHESTLIVNHVQKSDAALYTVVIKNKWGRITSQAASLRVK